MRTQPVPIICAQYIFGCSQYLPILFATRDHFNREREWLNPRHMLRPAMKRFIELLPPHQIDAQNPFLQQAAPISALHKALEDCCDHVIQWHGHPVFHFDRLPDFQEMSKLIMIDQLWACSLAGAIRKDQARREDLENWLQLPMFPEVTAPFLESLYRRGLIDLHQHYGASGLPSTIWVRAINNPRRLMKGPYQFRDDAMNLPEGWNQFDLYVHLTQARWFRRFLYSFAENGFHGPFPYDPNACREALLEVASYISAITGNYRDRMPPEMPDLYLPDVPGPRDYQSERRFLVQCFAKLADLKNRQHPDPATFMFYWGLHYYLLIQNIFMQSYVQQDQHIGFEEFSRFERGVGLQAYKKQPWPEAAASYIRDHRLKAIEVRVVPEKRIDRQINLIKDIFPRFRTTVQGEPEQDNNKPELKHGLIFHVIKMPDKTRIDNLEVIPARHHKVRMDTYRQLRCVVQTNKYLDGYQRLCLGIDAANDELFAPPEVFAPSFRVVRDQFATPKRRYNPLDPQNSRPRSLAVTFHAGESFTHILGGIRAVDEAVELIRMRPGDRIGHGLALGVGVKEWHDLLGPAIQLPARGQWLDNLVWMDAILGHSGLAASSVRHYLDRHIEVLTHKIYNEVLPAGLLQRAWACRNQEPIEEIRAHEPFLARSWDDCLKKDPNALELFERYHFDCRVRREYDQPYTVKEKDLPPPRDWFAALEECQKLVLRKLHDKHIAIEVNPTSNLRIGPFFDLADHPIFKWFPVNGDREPHMPKVTLNADNYCVFQTTMPLEYAYLAKAALEKGYSQHDIEAWLEEIRCNGFQYSFMDVAP